MPDDAGYLRLMIKKLTLFLLFCLMAYNGLPDETKDCNGPTVVTTPCDSIKHVVDSIRQQADSLTWKGDSIVNTAMRHLGKKYRMGHCGPDVFDCSGFTSFVYAREGITIGRSSRDQFCEGEKKEVKELRKGDLVFFAHPSRRSYINHVGIVTEVDTTANRFRFIHASRRGITIDTYPDAVYYKVRYVSARRILTEQQSPALSSADVLSIVQ